MVAAADQPGACGQVLRPTLLGGLERQVTELLELDQAASPRPEPADERLDGISPGAASTLVVMRQELHPEYVEARVRCTCGNEFTTRSTEPELHVEICSNCHPFYTGRQKLVDTGGRVERFKRRAARRRSG